MLNKEEYMIVAEWTGNPPCLCSGQWKLYMDGEDISFKIPEYLKRSEMNTYGSYDTWKFKENWSVEWSTYRDGMKQDEWIKENKEWLDTISTDYSIQRQIYDAISEEDWRHNSCGGCI